MYIIGVSGKTGCGKTTFSKYLVDIFEKSAKKAIYIDIDKVGYNVVTNNEKVQKALIKRFGYEILENKVISIKKLNDLVFSREATFNSLNRITLPAICEEISNLISLYSEYDYIILDYALLPEIKKYFNLCNYKILLESSFEDRKNRVILRDNIDEDKFQKREKTTLYYNKKDFDIVINNDNIEISKSTASNIVFHLNEIKKSKKIAYYPGSFDPLTRGHMDIINKVFAIGFDEIIIAVTKNNSKKSPMFSLEERYDMIKELYKYNSKVKVVLVDSKKASVKVAKEYGCQAMIRGLRNVTDFEYEIDLAKVNSTISTVTTIFLTASHKYDFVSSSTTRELAYLGEDISFYVPPLIKKKLINKLNELK